MPLPGIECGDMGPKMGYNSKNNGFVRFTNVRIPRDQLLQKLVEVDREGNFSLVGDPRSLYSVMMDIRIQLILHSGNMLMKASVIALRYSACRRQFKNDPLNKKAETRLIDYQTQQMKLVPLMA
jgi:acyl-CoA oxidase